MGTMTAQSSKTTMRRRPPRDVIGPGAEGIAHVLKDAIPGATLWIERDGKIRVIN
jgi:hypothetical protein